MIKFFKKYKCFHLKDRYKLISWIKDCVHSQDKIVGEIFFFFLSDRRLLKENIKHLNHDTFTDVITFNYSECPKIISGEVLISIERVRENAKINHKDFQEELKLVIIHSVIHLMGYNDISSEEKIIMRDRENFFLSKY